MRLYQGPTHRERILGELSVARDYPPTMRELAEALGMSFGNLRYHLEHLRAIGYVGWEPNVSRTLQITAAGRAATRDLRALNGKETPQ